MRSEGAAEFSATVDRYAVFAVGSRLVGTKYTSSQQWLAKFELHAMPEIACRNGKCMDYRHNAGDYRLLGWHLLERGETDPAKNSPRDNRAAVAARRRGLRRGCVAGCTRGCPATGVSPASRCRSN